MKKIVLFAVLGLVAVAGIAIFSASEHGEKSPFFARGNIELDPSLVEDADGISTLYVVVYDMDSPMPMPYGAMKERLDSPATAGVFFPLTITKEKLMVMNPNRPVPQRMRLKARLDKDGNAGMDQPGDLTGEISGINFGESNVTILINSKK